MLDSSQKQREEMEQNLEEINLMDRSSAWLMEQLAKTASEMRKLKADNVWLEAERKEQQTVIFNMNARRDNVNEKYIEIDKKDDRIQELEEGWIRLCDVVKETGKGRAFEEQDYQRERYENRRVGAVLIEEEST